MHEITTIHDQTPYANRTVFWLPSDTKELWLESIKDKKKLDYLKKMGWDQEDSISFSFNSHGFRCQEFTDQKNIVALGCSFTAGTGLNQDQVWPELISKYLNKVVYNLGVFGLSLDGCYRLARHYLPLLRPTMVIMCEPPEHRLELIGDGITTSVQFWQDQYGILAKQWFTYADNYILQRERNIAAIEKLCNKMKIPLYFISSPPKLDNARDFLHNGPISHQHIVKEFVEKYNL